MPSAEFVWSAGLTIGLALLSFYNWFINQQFMAAQKIGADARGEAAGAKAAVEIVQRQLEAHKLHAAENFATETTIERTEKRLEDAIDKVEARMEMRFSEINVKLDDMAMRTAPKTRTRRRTSD